MKLNFKNQLIVLLALILLGNIASTLFHHWAFRSAGFIIGGMLFLFHPVLPKGMESSTKGLLWSRMAGVVIILLGVFTRAFID